MVQLKIGDALGIFIRGLDHIDYRLIDHGTRVAYIAYQMLQADGKYSENSMREIAFVTLMHDIGAYKTEEIDRMLEFESTNIWEHSVYGYLFTKKLTPFGELASAILFHHTNYESLRTLDVPCKEVAQIINLADRVDTYIRTVGREGLETAAERGRNVKFSPEVLRLLHDALKNDDFVGKVLDGSYKQSIMSYLKQSDFSHERVNDFLKMVMYVIDFRSVFTVTHTLTTMGISDELGRLMGVRGEDAEKLHIGAQLHDLGKIAIPITILEKQGKLTPEEMDVMRTHVDITEEIIGHAIDDVILQNAIRHHEKLDGTGYPRGLSGKDLTLPQRIVAVADIVSALKGQRSYKEAYSKEKILFILDDLAGNGKICPDAVNVLKKNYDTIMDNVLVQSGPAIELYKSINSEYETLRRECNKIVS